MSNLSEFLKQHGLSTEDVTLRSEALERPCAPTRKAFAKRRQARRDKKPYQDAGAEKPSKLGRGASGRTLKEALAGTPIPRLGRKKITRAVNSLLASAKKEAVEWRALFSDVKAKRRKAEKK